MDSAENEEKERLKSLLAEIAGSFVRFEVDPKAMVTVTRTEMSEDSKTAKFLISVFPKNKEGNFSRSQQKELRVQKLFKDKNENEVFAVGVF